MMTSSHVGVNRQLVPKGTPWITGRVYQWDKIGKAWYMLPPPDNSNRQNAAFYLLATSDLTEGAPNAVFSFAQIRSLVANDMFADLMDSFEFVLSKRLDHNGNERFGSIRSDNYGTNDEQGKPQGFIIRHNGDAEFNNGTFRGELKAATGTFTGKLEAATGTFTGTLHALGDSVFGGNIDTGVFQVMPSQTTPFDTTGHNLSSFWSYVRNQLSILSTTQELTLFPVSSSGHPSFGSRITMVRFRNYGGRVDLTYANGTELAFTGTGFSFNFSFAIGATGKKIRMLNLPTGMQSESGTVYKKPTTTPGEYQLFVKDA